MEVVVNVLVRRWSRYLTISFSFKINIANDPPKYKSSIEKKTCRPYAKMATFKSCILLFVLKIASLTSFGITNYFHCSAQNEARRLFQVRTKKLKQLFKAATLVEDLLRLHFYKMMFHEHSMKWITSLWGEGSGTLVVPYMRVGLVWSELVHSVRPQQATTRAYL